MKAFHLTGPAPYYTNSFLLISEAGHGVIIDPAPAAEQVEELLQKENARLTHILLTHGHFDHAYSLDALAQRYAPALYLDPEDARGSEKLPITRATLPYSEETPLVVDELTIRAWHTPGHTPGSWVLEYEGLLFTGDTLFLGSVGRTDLEGGSPAQQRHSLVKLKALPLPDDTQVLPGHGPFSTLGAEKEQNPYLAF